MGRGGHCRGRLETRWEMDGGRGDPQGALRLGWEMDGELVEGNPQGESREDQGWEMDGGVWGGPVGGANPWETREWGNGEKVKNGSEVSFDRWRVEERGELRRSGGLGWGPSGLWRRARAGVEGEICRVI